MGLRSALAPFAAALVWGSVLTAVPAQAQMYKWVDDKGVVSYSNTPPPATSTKKVEAVADRVSVYTPDDELKHALSAQGRREAKAETLGRKLEAERTARRSPQATPSTSDSRAAAYERCVAERRVDCESVRTGLVSEPFYGYNGYYPQFVVGARGPLVQPAPFFVSENPAPKVGISTAPPVGLSTAPKVGIDDRPPVGAPPRNRPVRQTR